MGHAPDNDEILDQAGDKDSELFPAAPAGDDGNDEALDQDDELDDDLDDDLDDELEDVPPPVVEEGVPANWADAIDTVPEDLKEGEIREGVVVAIDADGVIVDVGGKVDGFIPLSEFPSASDRPQVDERIEVAVVKMNEDNETIRLSKRRADYERVWNDLEEKARTGGIVQAMVTERVKGGLRVDVGVSGFIPASHVGTRNPRNLERFVGRGLRLKVLEADRQAKKVILSHRELVDEERAKRREETMTRIEEGAICEGKVRNLTNYGAFVDLGGVDGLLHVSEMSWTRIAHPSEVLKVGDTVRVVVLEIAGEGDRISLGMRQILPDPWKEAAAKLKPNSVVKSRITRVVRTGAFAQLLEAGIEGFIPIRELSEKRIADPSDVIAKDQEVELKILDIRREARKMTLSLVAAEQEKERGEYRDFMATQVTARPTLGDQFGAVLASLRTVEEPPGEPQATPEAAVAPPPAPEAAVSAAPEAAATPPPAPAPHDDAPAAAEASEGQ